MQLRIAVIYGSVRPQRVGIRMARYVARAFRERGHESTLIDPLEHDVPLLQQRYRDYGDGEAPEVLHYVHRVFERADAFVAVSAEYNGSIPPALVNVLDYFLPEYARKPSAVCTYSPGPLGGALAAIPLRHLFTVLGAPPIGAPFRVGRVHETFDDSGHTDDEDVHRRFNGFADQVEWYAHALRTAREADSGAT